MTSLLPILATQTAPLARAAALRVEASVTTLSEDSSKWARARGGREENDRPGVQTILPPDRSTGGLRGTRTTGSNEDATWWPSSAFFTQHLSQEALPDDAPMLDHAGGASKYPSLGFDTDIFLPGETIRASAAATRRLDITV